MENITEQRTVALLEVQHQCKVSALPQAYGIRNARGGAQYDVLYELFRAR